MFHEHHEVVQNGNNKRESYLFVSQQHLTLKSKNSLVK